MYDGIMLRNCKIRGLVRLQNCTTSKFRIFVFYTPFRTAVSHIFISQFIRDPNSQFRISRIIPDLFSVRGLGLGRQ